MPNVPEDPATVSDCLTLGAGLSAGERDRVVTGLRPLDRRLRTFPAASTRLDVSVKDRDRPGQAMTLVCQVAGRASAVGTSHEEDLDRALAEVREHVRRQLDDGKNRREPQNRRGGSATVRSTPPS